MTDPDRRLLIVSCGAALHHARIALAAAGHTVRVERRPDPDDPDLLARIVLTGRQAPDQESRSLAAAIERRRTDRRAFGPQPVPQPLLARLTAAVEAEQTRLHVVRRDEMPLLAIATDKAATAEQQDTAYRQELARWTHRPAAAGDGVPANVAVQPSPRRVPVRDHVPGETAGLTPGDGFDSGAAWAILYGPTDEPSAWLHAGEALSALLLTATAAGLATAPFSDTVELAWPRLLLHRLLADVGYPYLVVRLGYRNADGGLPPAPRREPADVIENM